MFLIAQCAVRALLVELLLPRGDLAPRVPQVLEPTHIQAFIAQLAVETFHVSVLLRLPRLNVHQLDAPFHAPGQKMPAGEVRPVVAANRQWVSRAVRIISSARVTRRLAKLVSTSSVKHSRVHSSTTLSTRIARPLAIASCAKSAAHSWLAAVKAGRGEPSRTSLLRFPAHRQPRFPVHAKDPLVIHALSAAAQQNMQMPVPKPRFPARQLHQPLAQRLVAARALVVKIRYRDGHQPASPLLAGLVVFPQPAHFLPQVYEPHPFFEITTFNMSLSRLKSATNFFNR